MSTTESPLNESFVAERLYTSEGTRIEQVSLAADATSTVAEVCVVGRSNDPRPGEAPPPPTKYTYETGNLSFEVSTFEAGQDFGIHVSCPESCAYSNLVIVTDGASTSGSYEDVKYTSQRFGKESLRLLLERLSTADSEDPVTAHLFVDVMRTASENIIEKDASTTLTICGFRRDTSYTLLDYASIGNNQIISIAESVPTTADDTSTRVELQDHISPNDYLQFLASEYGYLPENSGVYTSEVKAARLKALQTRVEHQLEKEKVLPENADRDASYWVTRRKQLETLIFNDASHLLRMFMTSKPNKPDIIGYSSWASAFSHEVRVGTLNLTALASKNNPYLLICTDTYAQTAGLTVLSKRMALAKRHGTMGIAQAADIAHWSGDPTRSEDALGIVLSLSYDKRRVLRQERAFDPTKDVITLPPIDRRDPIPEYAPYVSPISKLLANHLFRTPERSNLVVASYIDQDPIITIVPNSDESASTGTPTPKNAREALAYSLVDAAEREQFIRVKVLYKSPIVSESMEIGDDSPPPSITLELQTRGMDEDYGGLRWDLKIVDTKSL